MKKVFLINPPLYYSQGRPRAIDVSVPPLGILYLASYISGYSNDFKVQVVDAAAEELSLTDLNEKIRRANPLVVGITSMTAQLQGAVELAGFLKRYTPKINIFLGGPHLSADPDFINRFKGIFDYGIVGEGEKTFLNSLIKISRQKKIARLQKGEVIEDLDTIPFPAKGLIKREKYSRRQSMMFSRGCPYNCYYCSRPSISRKVRYRTAQNLIEEIKSVYQDCQGQIDFQDDTLTLNRERVLEFCREVLRNDLKLDWRCNARIDLVDQELLSAMSQAGCKLIHFGIEAGNEEVRRKTVNKGSFTNKQIYRVFNLCRKSKINIGAYYMLGHPGETRKELNETKKMIFDSKIDLLGLSIPTPFPGSNLYKIAEKRKIINKKIIDDFARKKLGEGYVGNYPVFIPQGLKRKYLFSLMREINRKFYLNFRFFWSRLRKDFGSFNKLSQDFMDLVSLVLRGVSSKKPYLK